MNILIIGSGGREHALALSLAADPAVSELHVAPGNAGTAEVATNHAVNATDARDVVALAERVGADLVVIGPEAPLVAGVADAVRDAGIDCFGPSGAAAELEGSKSFAKQIMAEAGVPTAMAHVCTTLDEVADALDQFGAPYVVKDDGLAAGKGVVVTDGPTGGTRSRSGLPRAPERRSRDRGVPRRSGGVAVRDHRRAHGRAAGPGTGLQAGRRG